MLQWSHAAALTVALALGGCGADDDENDAPAQGPDVTGTWTKACAPASTSSTLESYVFEGAAMTMSIKSFGTATCTGSELQEFKTTATYERVKALQHATGGYPMNIAYSEVAMTPKDAEFVTLNNESQICGFTDWTLNVEHSLKGATTCPASYQTFVGFIGQTKGMYYTITDGTKMQFVNLVTGQLGTDAHVKQ